MTGRSDVRGIGFGMIGGLAGTFLMDIVMVLTFIAVGQPADTFFSMVGERLGFGSAVGILVHNLVGLSGGIFFSLAVLKIRALAIGSRRKAVKLGLAAGILTIPLGCIPLALWLDQPIPEVVAFSLLPHLVWGTVLGWVFGYGMVPSDPVSRT